MTIEAEAPVVESVVQPNSGAVTISPTLNSSLSITTNSESKNRLFKSAMSEQLGNEDNNPTEELLRLYDAWAQGGTGIVVTGNVMVDRTALGEPKNVVLDDNSDLSLFSRWAEAGTRHNTQLWMQLNHPGKQIPNFLNKKPVAPSAVPLGNGLEGMFNPPRELSDEEILSIINKFAVAAGKAKETGFSGVQIHGAHGYLVNQFLSPHHNRREDHWGGSLENRMRFVREIYKAIRAQVGDNYPVGIKLNSADFQKGGFSEEESMEVIRTLQDDGINLIEVSGGNYENPAMVGSEAKDSTIKREAYFLDYAEKARKLLRIPFVLTGGFRSTPAMNQALASGAIDMVGIARPLAVDPATSQKLLDNPSHKIELKELTTGFAKLDFMTMLDITWYEHQMERIGKGKSAKPNMSPWRSVFKTFMALGSHSMKRRRA